MAKNKQALVAAIAMAFAAGAAFAQVQQLPAGHALDANPMVGSGGSNQPVQGYVPLNQNDVINGNVSGLRYFHGPTAVPSEYQFQGPLGSSSLYNFARQSAGGGANGGLSQSYYLPSAVVSASQGGIYSAPMGSGFDSQLVPRSAVSPLATPEQLGALTPGASGVPRFAFDRLGTQAPLVPGSPGAVLSSPLFALRIGNVMQGPATGESLPTSGENAPGALKKPTLPGGVPLPDNPDDITKPPGRDVTLGQTVTGHSDPRIQDQNPDVRHAMVNPQEKPPEDNRISDTYRTLLDDLKKAEKEGGETEAAGPDAQAPGSDVHGSNMMGEEIDPLTGLPRRLMLKPPEMRMGAGGSVPGTGMPASGAGSVTPGTPVKPGTSKTPDARGTRGAVSPRRLEDLPTSTLLAGSRVKPIKSFVQVHGNGDTTRTDVLMARAEAALKQGRFLEAAEAYQLALSVDPNNGLALVGRAHAEMGAGMYQSAAFDLKFVFTRNPEMLGVKYELGAFLPQTRLDFLVKDLASLTDNKDMADTASFLLSYLYYQTGRKEQLQTLLQKWSGASGEDHWQTVASRAWNVADTKGAH